MNKPKDPRNPCDPPAAVALDEAAWHAWLTNGRLHDRRRSAAQVKAIQAASIAALLAAAGIWSPLAWFEFGVRLVVTSGALVVMFQALRSRYHGVALAFAALALLYNPVAPVFGFTGDWQRAVVLVSVLPFVASLIWPHDQNARMAHNA